MIRIWYIVTIKSWFSYIRIIFVLGMLNGDSPNFEIFPNYYIPNYP